MDSDRAAAYDANAVDVQIIKSEGTGVRRIKLRSTISACDGTDRQTDGLTDTSLSQRPRYA